MSDADDDRPQRKPNHEIGTDLSMISVHELKSRIDLLRDEISRIEGEISRKTFGRLAAENLFKS
jgi:uncharacterized small protein (DUF1192 family)